MERRSGAAGGYERRLGWPTAAGPPLQLATGVRFDVLDVPLAAGLAVLGRFPRTGPAAAVAGRALRLLALGSAEEVPGLLDWPEWGGSSWTWPYGGRWPVGRPPRPAAGRACVDAAAWCCPGPGGGLERTCRRPRRRGQMDR